MNDKRIAYWQSRLSGISTPLPNQTATTHEEINRSTEQVENLKTPERIALKISINGLPYEMIMQAARRNNITRQRMHILVQQNRVAGATRVYGHWFVPAGWKYVRLHNWGREIARPSA